MGAIIKNDIVYAGVDYGASSVVISWADYQALSEDQQKNGTVYFIPDYNSSATYEGSILNSIDDCVQSSNGIDLAGAEVVSELNEKIDDKVNLAGDTLTGQLTATALRAVNTTGETQVMCEGTAGRIYFYSVNDATGSRGIWGHNASGESKGILSVNQNNDVTLNGHATLDLPLTGGTLTGNLRVSNDNAGYIELRNDSEGGNLDIVSPNNVVYEFDAYNDNLRVYTYDSSNTFHSASFTRDGYAVTDVQGTLIGSKGGTITGQIKRESGGSWITGRDNAVVRQTKQTTTEGQSWNPVVSVKTAAGNWTIGNVGGEKLGFSYDTDTNYAANNNANSVYYLNTNGSFSGIGIKEYGSNYIKYNNGVIEAWGTASASKTLTGGYTYGYFSQWDFTITNSNVTFSSISNIQLTTNSNGNGLVNYSMKSSPSPSGHNVTIYGYLYDTASQSTSRTYYLYYHIWGTGS